MRKFMIVLVAVLAIGLWSVGCGKSEEAAAPESPPAAGETEKAPEEEKPAEAEKAPQPEKSAEEAPATEEAQPKGTATK